MILSKSVSNVFDVLLCNKKMAVFTMEALDCINCKRVNNKKNRTNKCDFLIASRRRTIIQK